MLSTADSRIYSLPTRLLTEARACRLGAAPTVGLSPTYLRCREVFPNLAGICLVAVMQLPVQKSGITDAVPNVSPAVKELQGLWVDTLTQFLSALEAELSARTRGQKLCAFDKLFLCHGFCWDSMCKIAFFAERSGAAPDDVPGLPGHTEMGILIEATDPNDSLTARRVSIEKALSLARSTGSNVVDYMKVHRELDERAFADEYGSRWGFGPRSRKLPW